MTGDLQIVGGPITGTPILTDTDIALFGGQLTEAGYDQVRISEIMGRMERRATTLAIAMAKTLATETISDLAGTVLRVHQNSAFSVYQKINQMHLGFGGMTHRRCALAALDVAYDQRPLHTAVPRRPTVGPR